MTITNGQVRLPAFADGSVLYFVSRRDGNPWNLSMLDPGELTSQVNFC